MGTLYIPGDSFLHRLDPRTKFWLLVATVLAVFLFYDPILQAIVMATLLLLAVLSGLTRELVGPFKFLLVFALFLMTVHGIVNPAGVTPLFWIGPVRFTREGLYYGAVMSYRIVGIGFAAVLFVLTTRPQDLSAAMIQSGLPRSLAFMLLSTLQIIPLLMREAQTVMQAQQARCMDVTSGLRARMKALIPALVPLFIITFIKMQELGQVLETRGYSTAGKKTSLYEVAYRTADYLFTGLVLAITLFLIVLRLSRPAVFGVNPTFLKASLAGVWLLTAALLIGGRLGGKKGSVQNA
jgi:energy-coupling factor transport system permease protein